MGTKKAKLLSDKEKDSLIQTLKARFEKHMHRHKGVVWSKVEAKLLKSGEKIQSLYLMEKSGGEPDVVIVGKKAGILQFVDCSKETPGGRRSACYDRTAQKARKKFPPKENACDMAEAMGVEMLSEDEYRALQKIEPFDTATSSWVKTPSTIRTLGGALFCDRRYDTVFTYHNGADSYYAVRGFRGKLKM